MRNVRRVIGTTAALAAGALALVTVAGCTGSATGSAQGGGQQSTTSDSAAPQGNQGITGGQAQAAGGDRAGASATVVGSTRPGTPECGAGDLKLSLGQGDTSMSQTHVALRFTNASNRSCVIVGYPGVSYVTGDNGRQVGEAAARDGGSIRQVTLVPGGTASTTVDMVTVSVFDRSVCQPTAVRGFRVYPPDDTASLFLPLAAGTQGCQGSTPDPQLSLTPITAGADASNNP